MANVLILGDSIVYGYRDKKGGWVTRLKIYLDNLQTDREGNNNAVFNLGISGTSTSYTLKRFDCETKDRIWQGRKNIIIFQLGKNDSMFIVDENRLFNPPKKFQTEVTKLLSSLTSLVAPFTGCSPYFRKPPKVS